MLEQRDALSRQIGDLQREHDDRDTEAKRVAEELSARFQDRDRRAVDLGAELKELREARSSELEEAQGLREELSIAQAALEQHRSELIEHREVVARLRTREKALAEQVAMLESQLGEVGEAEVWKPQPEATHLDERAVRALGHLDRVVEVVEREARHDAERMLRKARERADEIIRSAEAERERRWRKRSRDTPTASRCGRSTPRAMAVRAIAARSPPTRVPSGVATGESPGTCRSTMYVRSGICRAIFEQAGRITRMTRVTRTMAEKFLVDWDWRAHGPGCLTGLQAEWPRSRK